MTTQNELQHTIVIERMFNAPKRLVWDVWTQDEHIAQWFGPKGFTTRVEKNDFQPGGKSRYVMIGPDGTEYPSEGVYKEITPYERIITSDEFGEEYKANNEVPKIDQLIIDFEDHGDQTKIRLTIVHPTERDRKMHAEMGVEGGWNSSFEKMDDYLRTLV